MSFLIYLVGIVDGLWQTCAWIGALFSGALLILNVTMFFVEEKDKGKDSDWVSITKTRKFLTYLSVILVSIAIFTPNSKTLAAMYLIPAIMESEKMQKIDGLTDKLLEVLEIKLDESLEDSK